MQAEICILFLVMLRGYKTRQQYLFITLVSFFFRTKIISPAKFWYQNTHKINTKGLWKPKFAFYTLWGSHVIRRTNSTYSVLWCHFFILKIILPSKFWYQNTHKINTKGLWKPRFGISAFTSKCLRQLSCTLNLLVNIAVVINLGVF